MPADHVIHDANGQAGASGEIRHRLLAVEPGRRRRAVMLRHLTELVAEVLGASPAAIDPAAPLSTLGFNSVRTLELHARLERSLRLKLPATLGWQFPTLAALAPHLADRMGIDLDAPPAGAPPVPAADDSSLDELSDADLAALLVAKIEQMDDAVDL